MLEFNVFLEIILSNPIILYMREIIPLVHIFIKCFIVYIHVISSHLFFTTCHLRNYLRIYDWEVQDLKWTFLKTSYYFKDNKPFSKGLNWFTHLMTGKDIPRIRAKIWLVLQGHTLQALFIIETEWNCQAEQGQNNGMC